MRRKPTPTEIIVFCREVQELCDRYGCDCYFVNYNSSEPLGEKLPLDKVRTLRSSDLKIGLIRIIFSDLGRHWTIWANCIHEFSENLDNEFMVRVLDFTFDVL